MRSYGEAIDVRTEPSCPVPSGAAGSPQGGDPLGGSAPPAQFLWRGRIYLVRDVLAHWVELGTWWSVRGGRPPGARSLPGPGVVPVAPADGTPGSDGTEAPAPHRSVAADVGAVEREVWRVEAAPGRSASPGVYDLVRDIPAHDPVAGPHPGSPPRWRLARALD